MTDIYKFNTRKGAILIVPNDSGRWDIVFDDEKLGSYHSARAAASDASAGATFMPSSGVEFYDLEIPEDLAEWARYPMPVPR